MNKLSPEIEEGNIEYKRKLDDSINDFRFQQLTSQLKWRINEGEGTAKYYIGVDDDGTIYGLDRTGVKMAVKVIKKMSKQIDAKIVDLEHQNVDKKHYIIVTIQKSVDFNKQLTEFRVAFVGNTGAGKSSLMSVLTYGKLDNGDGSARLSLFNHKHEVYSGKTSSVSTEIIGFDEFQMYNYKNSIKSNNLESTKCGQDYICKMSDRIITLIDLPGKDTYFKTIYRGLLSYYPDYVMIIVDGTNTDYNTIFEYLSYCYFLELEVAIIVTGYDLTTFQLIRWIDPKIPIFNVSNVTGDGIDSVVQYLSNITKEKVDNLEKKRITNDVEFHINYTQYIPDIGLIVSGIVVKGPILVRDKLKVGVFPGNLYHDVIVQSIHYKQSPTKKISTGQSASIVVNDVNVKKGMILFSPSSKIKAWNYFEAEIKLVSHPTLLKVNSEFNVYIRNGKYTCVVFYTQKPGIKQGETSIVQMKFKRGAIIKNGDKLIFRNGDIHGYGTITNCL